MGIVVKRSVFPPFAATECGLFKPDEDPTKGRWLEMGRTLEYYHLKSGVCRRGGEGCGGDGVEGYGGEGRVLHMVVGVVYYDMSLKCHATACIKSL